MTEAPASDVLYQALIHELTKALGLLRVKGGRAIATALFGKVARRVSEMGIGVNRVVAESGQAAAANWLLPNFVAGHEARGAENIPAAGPLVIASNHPAAVDSLVISAHMTRPDYKIIIGHNVFFESLPNVVEKNIMAPPPENLAGRMHVVRECLRHLESGGTLLIFPRGAIEPDPDSMPNADGEFHLWSRSLDIFLQRVPETRVLVTIVSGVIHPAYIHHPLTYIRRDRANRQRLAFLLQMTRQVLAGREMFGLRPRVTFGELVHASGGQARSQVRQAAGRVLSEHMSWR